MINNKQQTAVEWLIDTIHNSQGMTQSDIDNVFELAKEMEKEQMTKAWIAGDGQHDKIADKLAEQWYEKTYGGNK